MQIRVESQPYVNKTVVLCQGKCKVIWKFFLSLKCWILKRGRRRIFQNFFLLANEWDEWGRWKEHCTIATASSLFKSMTSLSWHRWDDEKKFWEREKKISWIFPIAMTWLNYFHFLISSISYWNEFQQAFPRFPHERISKMWSASVEEKKNWNYFVICRRSRSEASK